MEQLPGEKMDKGKAKKKGDHIEVVRLPPWLASVHAQWRRRNQSVPKSQELSFEEYVVNRDVFAKLEQRLDLVVTENARLKEDLEGLRLEVKNCASEMVQMRLGQGILCKELTHRVDEMRAEIDAVRMTDDNTNDKANDEAKETLKEPRTQEAFDAVRLALYTFNKRNVKRKQRGAEPKTWGRDGEYDLISNRESLEAWLDSKHAKDFKLDRDVIDHFNVCVVNGELVTISKEFKGGVGIEAFWVPQNKYDSVCQRSSTYEETESVLRDPRHGYMLNRVKWVPSAGQQKRKM